jgi:hypothetical protein
VSGLIHPRLRLPLCAALAALAAWLLVPGSVIDRALFGLVARSRANPPFFITGDGSFQKPWQLRTFASVQRPDTGSAPLIVSLGDDAGAFFQSSPPSPIDMAVILSNFQRLGATKAATAAVLAWDAPDPIGLAALDKVLGRFDSLVMAAPLTRGAAAEPLPEAFRNASLPISHVRGDITALPVVNRIPLTGVILGRENTRAGFQSLDFEAASRFPPLLARWEDRVVFAFPLLVALQRFDMPLEGMEIRPGEFLRLWPQGPVVPLDRFGRMTAEPGNLSPYAEISAELLIDGGDELFPKQAPQPVILRDDRSAAEPATRRFSAELPATIAAIASDTSLVPARSFARFTLCQEIVLLAVWIAGIALVSRLAAYARQITYSALAAFAIGAHFIAASQGVWLPALAALAAVVVAFVVSRIRWMRVGLT